MNTLASPLLSRPAAADKPAGSNGHASPELRPPSLDRARASAGPSPLLATGGPPPERPTDEPGSFAASLAAASAPGSGAPGRPVSHRDPGPTGSADAGATGAADTGTSSAGRPVAHQRAESAARHLPADAARTETGAWLAPTAGTLSPASPPLGSTTPRPGDAGAADAPADLPAARIPHTSGGPVLAQAEALAAGHGPAGPVTSQIATHRTAPVDRHQGDSVSQPASEGAGSEPDAPAPATGRSRGAPLPSQGDTQATRDPSIPPDRLSRGTTAPEAGALPLGLPGHGASGPTTSPAAAASDPATPDLPAGHGVPTGVLDRHLVAVLQPALRQTDGAWRVTVRLDPPELGTVDATVTVQDGTTTVVLAYQTETTRNALQSVLHTIQSSLGSRSTVALADGRTGGEQAGTAARHHQPGSPPAGQKGRGGANRGSTTRSGTADPGNDTVLPAGSAPRSSRYGQIDVLA